MENEKHRIELLSQIEANLAETKMLASSDNNPFPYDDLRKLSNGRSFDHEHFGSDLNVYLMDIYGFASWGKKAFSWDSKKLSHVESYCSNNFFQSYRKYADIEDLITQEEYPELYDTIQFCNKLRIKLLAIVEGLRAISLYR